MSLAEFVYLSKSVFQKFSSELERREISLILPLHFNQAQIGAAQVDTQILNFYNSINTNNIASAESMLVWLLTYQLEYGLYEQSSKKLAESVSGNLNKLSERLNLIETSIVNKQKEVEKQFGELETTKKEIQSLIVQKPLTWWKVEGGELICVMCLSLRRDSDEKLEKMPLIECFNFKPKTLTLWC